MLASKNRFLPLGTSVKSTHVQPVGRRRKGTPTILAVAIAAALAGAVPAADAAGLGRLTVQSALGQPLRAEVEVTSLGLDELGSLSARLASPEAFRQAGLEFNPALAVLKFSIDRRPDRSAVVRITSAQPINEPFVDLMVELNWASGKFVREYTFLLDPPELRIGARGTVAGGPATQQVVTPSVATTGSPVAQATPAPAAAPAAASSAAPAARRSASGASPTAAAARPAPTSTQPAPGASGTPGQVTTHTGDTLAGIAARVKPADVSLEQAIIAIYEANRSAFFGSVHQMLAGKQLEIPGHETMAAVDAAAARSQIRADAATFRAYRERLAAAVRRVEPAQAGQSAAGTIAGVEEKSAPAAAGDQLKLSRPGEAGGKAAGKGAGAAGAAVGTDKGAEAQIAREAALREQQERVAALEKNVADLQKLVELKNQQLAELQRQVEAARAPGATVAGKVAAPEAGAAASAASGVAASGAAPAAPAAGQAPAGATAPAAEPATSAAPQPAAPSAAQPAPAQSTAAQSAPAATPAPATQAAQAPATTPAAKPAPAPAPVEEPSFIDDLIANPLTLPGLGAIVLALGAYGMYSVRRRKKAEQFDEDSLVAADAFTANSLFGSTGGQAVDTSSSLFATSTRDSGVDVHSTEVDPIAEAEVYIAYGREAQAEEILKEALKKQPERQAIRLKLLEIHAGRKDAAAFGALAQEMYDQTGGQNEEWPKVVTLGLSIDPANPLYTGQGEAAAAPAGGFPAPAAPVTSAAPAAAPSASGAALSGAAGLAAAAAGAAAIFPADRMLPGDEAAVHREAGPVSFAETVPMDGDASAAQEMPALDFDLDLDTTIGRAASMREAAGTPVEEAALSESDLARAIDGRFELPSLEVDAAEAPPAEARLSTAATETEPAALADLGDFKIDLPALEGLDEGSAIDERAVAGAIGDVSLAAVETEVAPPVESSRWQEMATKLDLASAYEEIGDKEGARELLEEVLKGGDSAQQQKARSMLAKIG